MADQDNDEAKEKEIKVDKWDSSAVRNALEDATKEGVQRHCARNVGSVYQTTFHAFVKMFFNNQSDFTEDFTLFDVKLVLCTVACLFSLFALLYDYFIVSMPDSWAVLLVCSVSYFVMMGVLTLFSTFVEKNYFYVAKERREGGIGAPSVWRVESSLPKYSDQFTLRASYSDSDTNMCVTGDITKSIASWFDERGVLHKDKLHEDLSALQYDVKHKKGQ